MFRNPLETDRLLLLVLRLGTFLCFAGWTWVHFYWQGPYGVLLWQEATFSLAERWGVSWEEFVGTGANDGLVQQWSGRIGWLYLFSCILSFTVRRTSRWQMAGLLGGAGLLAILAYAKFVSAQRQLPMLVEHGGQVLMPVLLVVGLVFGVRHRVTILLAVIALILTFAGHGAYALGWPWPTPANFSGMTRVILGVDAGTAKTLLVVAGILDLVVCVGILVPAMRRPCAFYAATWGLLTALARPVAGMSLDLNYWGSDQYLHEAVLRAPHYLIPLYLFLVWRKSEPEGTG
tara:strand:+ start:4251 stop:5117 length:867 start_codon:yes stop_codon:yes gene_type:complete